MTDPGSLPLNTPVLVSAGQVVRHQPDAASPLQLAAEAARTALGNSGGEAKALAAAIDTVSVTRLFSDSMGFQPCQFGSSNNPPMSVATGLGAEPAHCIYGQVGGNEPQSRIIEFARDIARGDRAVVLLAGGEATYNQRSAERAGQTLDWREEFPQPVEDRGWGKLFVSDQELSNGLLAPIFYFALIEQAQAAAAGADNNRWREQMARLSAGLSTVAAANAQAQFRQALSPDEILAGPRLNHLYNKAMVARDSVNLGAALLMCSVESARRLCIPEQNWIYCHGLAEGEDVNLSQREDPGRSDMMRQVFQRALAQAQIPGGQPDLLDLYSCFPCAVTAAADILQLPTAEPEALTLTGGLPFFGGPGNNYAMHSLAETVLRLRQAPESFAMVTAVGGMLSKHAAGIYSRQPALHDWSQMDTSLDSATVPRREIIAEPKAGSLLSYVVNFSRGEPKQVMALAETQAGLRFVAVTAPEDIDTVSAMQKANPVGLPIRVKAAADGQLHFQLAP